MGTKLRLVVAAEGSPFQVGDRFPPCSYVEFEVVPHCAFVISNLTRCFYMEFEVVHTVDFDRLVSTRVLSLCVTVSRSQVEVTASNCSVTRGGDGRETTDTTADRPPSSSSVMSGKDFTTTGDTTADRPPSNRNVTSGRDTRARGGTTAD